MTLNVGQQRVKGLRRHGLVDVSPINTGRRRIVLHQKTVLGGPSSEFPRLNGQCALAGQDTFATKEGLQNQFGWGKVPVGPAHAFKTNGV